MEGVQPLHRVENREVEALRVTREMEGEGKEGKER